MTSWSWREQQAPRDLYLQCSFWTSLLEAQPGVCLFSSATDFVDLIAFNSAQSLSRVQLCDPMDCSMPGLPVDHHLPELAQTHVHQVSDAIQPSHPLSSSSSPAFNLSQYQGLFPWVSSLHQVAKSIGASASVSVPQMNIQNWFPLGSTGLITLQSKGLSRVFFSTTVQKH